MTGSINSGHSITKIAFFCIASSSSEKKTSLAEETLSNLYKSMWISGIFPEF